MGYDPTASRLKGSQRTASGLAKRRVFREQERRLWGVIVPSVQGRQAVARRVQRFGPCRYSPTARLCACSVFENTCLPVPSGSATKKK